MKLFLAAMLAALGCSGVAAQDRVAFLLFLNTSTMYQQCERLRTGEDPLSQAEKSWCYGSALGYARNYVEYKNPTQAKKAISNIAKRCNQGHETSGAIIAAQMCELRLILGIKD